MIRQRPIRIETAWVPGAGTIVTGSLVLAPDDPAYAEELAACLEEERRWGVPVPFVEADPEPYAPAPVRFKPGSPGGQIFLRPAGYGAALAA